MVNLNRQIRTTQARQGGFSAHVLPGAVGYQPPVFVVFTDGESLRVSRSDYGGAFDGTGTSTLIYTGSEPWDGTSFPYTGGGGGVVQVAPQYAASGGLGDGPYFPVLGSDDFYVDSNSNTRRYRGFASTDISNPNAATLEGFFRMPQMFAQVFRTSRGDHLYNRRETPGVFTFYNQSLFSSFSTGVSVVPNEWLHVAMVHAAGQIRLYVGGALCYEGVGGATDIVGAWLPGSHCDIGQWRYTPRVIYTGATITPPSAPFIAV